MLLFRLDWLWGPPSVCTAVVCLGWSGWSVKLSTHICYEWVELYTLCAFMACRGTSLCVHIAVRFFMEISWSLTHFVVFLQLQSVQMKAYIPVLLFICKLLTPVKYVGIYVSERNQWFCLVSSSIFPNAEELRLTQSSQSTSHCHPYILFPQVSILPSFCSLVTK
jgi:hypothetical protein